ncbi:ACP phosphodiesterase [Oxalobacteraceae bacterium R-40]|uniref:ACP phosphodiesterase n=1 Tax=Keguizhuia sedimenti TaxID=3064264 RepID=A0ABU1BK68_9BURK|nr:ACP phosphodiesterase [Oxalobacteraceae bacterium R-40]
MNYLAHILLAQQSEDAMVGALLGDFCKPNDADRYGKEIAREIFIHRKVDAFTDSHPVILQAKSLFRQTTRRYAGISLDVYYDHILARYWQTYCAIPLDPFVHRFYRALLDRREMLPVSLERQVGRMVNQDWLGSYRDFDSVKTAINRISERLSRNGDLLKDSIEDLEINYDELCDGFHAFFPDLIRFAQHERERFLSVGLKISNAPI